MPGLCMKVTIMNITCEYNCLFVWNENACFTSIYLNHNVLFVVFGFLLFIFSFYISFPYSRILNGRRLISFTRWPMDDLENVRAIYLFIYVVVVLLIQAKVTIILKEMLCMICTTETLSITPLLNIRWEFNVLRLFFFFQMKSLLNL